MLKQMGRGCLTAGEWSMKWHAWAAVKLQYVDLKERAQAEKQMGCGCITAGEMSTLRHAWVAFEFQDVKYESMLKQMGWDLGFPLLAEWSISCIVI
jgi:hypothetical protein